MKSFLQEPKPKTQESKEQKPEATSEITPAALLKSAGKTYSVDTVCLSAMRMTESDIKNIDELHMRNGDRSLARSNARSLADNPVARRKVTNKNRMVYGLVL